ncbi:SDR family oxidoreductase [soil metagenome]
MRRILITGGSRGIGLRTAEAFVRKGDEVTITGRDPRTLVEAQATLADLGSIRTMEVDSSNLSASAVAFGSIEVDILVSNVGAGFSGSIQQTPLDEWQRMFDTNVTSAFVAIQALLPGMVGRGWGRIVTVGSMASHQAIRYGVAYTVSKHALLGLTRAVAADLTGTGVTANMVAPAFVRTDMMAENARRIVEKSGMTMLEAERKLAALSPLGRLIEPEEVAAAILSFASEDAGDLNGVSTEMGF